MHESKHGCSYDVPVPRTVTCGKYKPVIVNQSGMACGMGHPTPEVPVKPLAVHFSRACAKIRLFSLLEETVLTVLHHIHGSQRQGTMAPDNTFSTSTCRTELINL